MKNDHGRVEIDVREFLSLLLKKSWILVISMVLAAFITGYYSYTRMADYYRAEATIYLGKESSLGSIDLGTITLNNQLMSDYISLINSRLVTDEVVKRLDLDMPGDLLKFEVNAYTPLKSNIPTRMFTVSYQGFDPVMTAQIVNTACEVVLDKAERIIGVNNAQIVDAALVPRAPVGPNRNRNIIIAAAAGLVMGVVVIFLAELMDYTFKKQEDIERILGLTVLGTIPLFKGEKRK